MYNLLNIYDCPKCGKRLSDEVEYISVQVSDEDWDKVPFCNSCKSEVKIRMDINPVTKQEIFHYEEVDDERAKWAHGFYDENEDDEDDENYTCSVCGGEFWEGGTSCTCEDWDEEPPEPTKSYSGNDELPF